MKLSCQINHYEKSSLIPIARHLEYEVVEEVFRRLSRETSLPPRHPLLCGVKIVLEGGEEDSFSRITEFLRRRYGKDNTVCTVVHHTEADSHLHFAFIPLTEEGRLAPNQIAPPEEAFLLKQELTRLLEAAPGEPEGLQGPEAFLPVWEEAAPALSTAPAGEPLWGAGALARENQSLRLENLILKRQVKGLVELISSEPYLEELFIRQMKKETQRRKTSR